MEEASGNISHSLIPCAAFGTGFGLLAVAVHAASAWSVEREAGQGGLDVLLSTPLSAAEFVRGKWWACFRPVLGVAVVPALAAVILTSLAPTLPSVPAGVTLPVTPVPLRAFDRVSAAVVVIGQPFAYGALVVSFGLWLATRCARANLRGRHGRGRLWRGGRCVADRGGSVHHARDRPQPVPRGSPPSARWRQRP